MKHGVQITVSHSVVFVLPVLLFSRFEAATPTSCVPRWCHNWRRCEDSGGSFQLFNRNLSTAVSVTGGDWTVRRTVRTASRCQHRGRSKRQRVQWVRGTDWATADAGRAPAQVSVGTSRSLSMTLIDLESRSQRDQYFGRSSHHLTHRRMMTRDLQFAVANLEL